MVKTPHFYTVRLIRDSRRYWPGFVALILLAGVSALLQTRVSLLWGELVDGGIQGDRAAVSVSFLGLLVACALQALAALVNDPLNAVTTEGMFNRIRERVFGVLHSADYAAAGETIHTGDLISRMGSDIEELCEIFAGQYTWYLYTVGEALAAAAACLFLCPALGGLYLAVLPVTVFLLQRMTASMTQRQRSALADTGRGMNVAAETLHHLQTVKAYGAEALFCGEFDACIDMAAEARAANERSNAAVTGLQYITALLQLGILFCVGILCVEKGLISVGGLIAFAALSRKVKTAIDLLSRMAGTWRKSEALSQRICELLDLPTEEGTAFSESVSGYFHKGEQPDAMDGQAREWKGNLAKQDVLLEIRNLRFSYEHKPVLEKLNLSVAPGQHVALLRPSGCGKTTLLRIICGFYSCGRGQVFFRGRDINDWAPEELRSRLSLVSQQAGLLGGTVFENVSAMAEDAGEEEVRAALSAASAWEFVAEMEKGMASDVGESGNRLSGGQRQRIALARAFYKDAELMILDEPTSALDLVAEQEIKSAMTEMLRGRAALIITHRTALVSDADYIYCMDAQGRIREEGPPGELMDRKGFFYSLSAENQQVQNRDCSLYRIWIYFGCLFLFMPLIVLGTWMKNTAVIYGESSLKKELFARLCRLTIQDSQRYATADQVIRITYDAGRAVGIYSGYAFQSFVKFLACLGISIGLLLRESAAAAAAGLALTLVCTVLSVYFNPKVRAAEQRARNSNASATAFLAETGRILDTVRIFQMQGPLALRYGQACAEAAKERVRYRGLNGISEALMTILTKLAQPAAFVMGLALWADGRVPVSKIVYIAGIIGVLADGMSGFALFMKHIQPPLVSARRVYELMGLPEENLSGAGESCHLQGFSSAGEEEREKGGCLDGTEQSGGAADEFAEGKGMGGPVREREEREAVCFRGVGFSYGSKVVLRNLHFSLRQGEMAVLVGASGNGKSTVLKQLLGFYPPEEGSIYLFGRDIAELGSLQCRALIGYVPQEGVVFSGNIAENLRMGKPFATDGELMEVVGMARMEDFVPDVHALYSVQVGEEGAFLSGGQRQRISIARALLRDAPLLQLDEATAALDRETERGWQETVASLRGKKTILAVAHRQQTVENADRVFWLEEGRIAQVGTHEELMGRSVRYRQIYQRNMC